MKKPLLRKTAFVALVCACLFAFGSCTSDEDAVATAPTRQATIAKKSDTAKAYTYVEQMPEFKGGEAALFTFLAGHIMYPAVAKEAALEGLTVVSFVVETDGSVTGIKTVKSLSPETDQEAARVVKLTSGSWMPGKQNGVLVPVQYTLPIRFALK
ncbi:energy transducer TonB [Pontibacter liquoris]|uniref:energy transducer TonB n=1 Tax=Pontibacter liquoris TaxID=2905677 RepID=UPI001FA728E9|nr:energy transducer TonB [Pontibacter liquoris]